MPNSRDDEIDFQVGLVRELLPLESAIAGPDVMRNLAAGATYVEASGGRPLSLMDGIQVLGCAFGLVQCALAAISLQSDREDRRRSAMKAMEQRQLHDSVLAQLLAEKPELATTLSRLIDERLS